MQTSIDLMIYITISLEINVNTYFHIIIFKL